MRLNILTLVIGNLVALAVGHDEKRDTSSFDVQSAASVLTSKFSGSATYTLPFITPGGNLLQPPQSIVGAIITGIPASVIVQLAYSTGRAALASEFKAGNTPAWYQTLPDPVKSYISALERQIAASSVNLSATPSSVNYYPDPTTTPTSSGSTDGENAAVTSSKSKGPAAPTAAPGLGFSVAAALGVLGAVIAL